MQSRTFLAWYLVTLDKNGLSCNKRENHECMLRPFDTVWVCTPASSTVNCYWSSSHRVLLTIDINKVDVTLVIWSWRQAWLCFRRFSSSCSLLMVKALSFTSVQRLWRVDLVGNTIPVLAQNCMRAICVIPAKYALMTKVWFTSTFFQPPFGLCASSMPLLAW
jgi:hypothetical protein